MEPMQTKKTATAVALEPAAQAALRRGVTRELAPEEERVLRMRLGAVPPACAPLERASGRRTDLEIELLAAEIEAHLRLREHRRTAAARAGEAAPSRSKEKIIRALRKKR
jgi:hypothetical protein